MKKIQWNRFYDDFLSLFFPRVCLNCNKPIIYEEEILCYGCRFSMPETDFHKIQPNLLSQKFIYESKVKFVSAYLYYQRKGIAQRLVQTMKYKNMPQIGEVLGKWYGYKLLKSSINIDIIVPVPLHDKKLALRGFNQSEVIAKGLSHVLGIPVDSETIVRVTNTATQTKKKKIDRWVNVDSIFECKTKNKFDGLKVMIVDDVLTTGATMGKLLDLLVKEGASEISIVALAAGSQ